MGHHQALPASYTHRDTQAGSYQRMLLADRESNYDWERDGEPVVYAIMSAAGIPEAAAEDVQNILNDEHGDFDSAVIGEETEFSDESYYEDKGPGAGHWHEEWDSFERSLKTEARFFSRRAADHLSAIFDGIDEMRTRDNRPLVIDAGRKQSSARCIGLGCSSPVKSSRRLCAGPIPSWAHHLRCWH